MYEGPDWDEVSGTTSTGYYVAHHPSEDTLWYMTTDGAVSEYELQNVPLLVKAGASPNVQCRILRDWKNVNKSRR